jgi:hypothetical protein
MKKRFGGLPAALLLGALAYGQPPNPIIIESTGVIHSGHEMVHAKNTQTLRWGLGKGATSWYVIFTGTSPCANGVKELGSAAGLAKTCSVQKAPAGTYKYSTSDRRGGTIHDPVIIVDQ